MEIKKKAYAKVNLTLEVLGVEPDGYHRICSIMQTINLYDIITFREAQRVYLSCNDPSLITGENLVIKTANLIKSRFGVNKGAEMDLHKEIPQAAGLGGGSSDAAATILALNKLWNLNLPQLELIELAINAGSDVPFFLDGGTALIEGRGEIITPLPALRPCWFVLLFLPHNITGKTKKMYSLLKIQHLTDGIFTREMVNIIKNKKDITDKLLYNEFDNVAGKAFSQIENYKNTFSQAGADKVIVCGSGPTLMTAVQDERKAYSIRDNLLRQGLEAKTVLNVPRESPDDRQE